MTMRYIVSEIFSYAHLSEVFAVAATQRFLLTGSGAPMIHIYRTDTPGGSTFQTIRDKQIHGIHHLVAAADCTLAVSSDFQGQVLLWRYDDFASLWTKVGEIAKEYQIGEIWALAITADGKYLATSGFDGKVRIWDLSSLVAKASWRETRIYETNRDFGICIAFSADGKFVASGHEKGTVCLFNNELKEMMYLETGFEKPIRSVAFSPLNNLLAIGGDSTLVLLYNVISGEQIGKLTGHIWWVMSIDFSPTGQWLLSGSYDGKVKIWSVATGRCIATYGDTDQPVWCVKWLLHQSEDRKFVVANGGGKMSVYQISRMAV